MLYFHHSLLLVGIFAFKKVNKIIVILLKKKIQNYNFFFYFFLSHTINNYWKEYLTLHEFRINFIFFLETNQTIFNLASRVIVW